MNDFWTFRPGSTATHDTQKVIFKFRAWFTIKKRKSEKLESNPKWKWNFLRLKKQFVEKFYCRIGVERKDGILFLNILFSFIFLPCFLLRTYLYCGFGWRSEMKNLLSQRRHLPPLVQFIVQSLNFALKNLLARLMRCGDVWRVCEDLYDSLNYDDDDKKNVLLLLLLSGDPSKKNNELWVECVWRQLMVNGSERILPIFFCNVLFYRCEFCEFWRFKSELWFVRLCKTFHFIQRPWTLSMNCFHLRFHYRN